MLFPRADWRDVYRHDPAGRLMGWDRETSDGTLRFDAAGRLIPDTDTGPEPVRHVIDSPEGGVPRLGLRKGSGTH